MLKRPPRRKKPGFTQRSLKSLEKFGQTGQNALMNFIDGVGTMLLAMWAYILSLVAALSPEPSVQQRSSKSRGNSAKKKQGGKQDSRGHRSKKKKSAGSGRGLSHVPPIRKSSNNGNGSKLHSTRKIDGPKITGKDAVKAETQTSATEAEGAKKAAQIAANKSRRKAELETKRLARAAAHEREAKAKAKAEAKAKAVRAEKAKQMAARRKDERVRQTAEANAKRKALERKRKAEEKKKAEEVEKKRKALEEEAKRRDDEARARKIEAKNKARRQQAEARRKAAEAEAKINVAEAEVEAKRKAAEVQVRRKTEAKRKADEAKAKRKAVEAEANRKAVEAEAKRKAVEAEAKRKAAEAEDTRKAAAQAEAAKKIAKVDSQPRAEATEASETEGGQVEFSKLRVKAPTVNIVPDLGLGRPRRPSTPAGLKTLSLSAALDEEEHSTSQMRMRWPDATDMTDATSPTAVPQAVQSCLPRYQDEGDMSKEKWVPGSASPTMYGATGQRSRRSLAEYEADQKAFRRRRKKKKRRRRRLLIAMKESEAGDGTQGVEKSDDDNDRSGDGTPTPTRIKATAAVVKSASDRPPRKLFSPKELRAILTDMDAQLLLAPVHLSPFSGEPATPIAPRDLEPQTPTPTRDGHEATDARAVGVAEASAVTPPAQGGHQTVASSPAGLGSGARPPLFPSRRTSKKMRGKETLDSSATRSPRCRSPRGGLSPTSPTVPHNLPMDESGKWPRAMESAHHSSHSGHSSHSSHSSPPAGHRDRAVAASHSSAGGAAGVGAAGGSSKNWRIMGTGRGHVQMRKKLWGFIRCTSCNPQGLMTPRIFFHMNQAESNALMTGDYVGFTIEQDIATGKSSAVNVQRLKGTGTENSARSPVPAAHKPSTTPSPSSHPYSWRKSPPVAHTSNVSRWRHFRKTGRTEGDGQSSPPIAADSSGASGTDDASNATATAKGGGVKHSKATHTTVRARTPPGAVTPPAAKGAEKAGDDLDEEGLSEWQTVSRRNWR